VYWEQREREEGVNGDATNIVEVFRECGSNRSNFVSHLFVHKCEGSSIGWREWNQGVRCGQGVAHTFCRQLRLVGGGKAVDGAIGVGGGGDDQEDLDASDAAFA